MLMVMARRNLGMTVLVVAGLGLLILNPFFYMGWQSAGAQNVDLEKREMVATLQLTNARATYEVSTLRNELNALQGEMNVLAGIPSFPGEAPSADLYTAVAREAGRSGVTVTALESLEKTGSEEIGDGKYAKSEVNVSVAGSLSQVESFLANMENSEFPTLRFEDVNLTKIEGESTWEGDLKLVVLSQM
jgi:Tfp pilus assembly protein PilO